MKQHIGFLKTLSTEIDRTKRLFFIALVPRDTSLQIFKLPWQVFFLFVVKREACAELEIL
jgi:hypothetical protein